MKLATVLTSISLLTPALATPTVNVHDKRDVAAIQGVLSDIDDKVLALGSAIEAKPLDADSIISQSNTLVDTITSGTSTVNAQPALGQLEALGLVSPTQKLADDTDATVQSLIGVKSDIIDLGEGCTTLTALKDQYDAATGLSDAVVSKVPASLADIAKELSDSISNAIQKGIDAYEGACDGSGEEPTSTGGPEPTSTQTSTPTKTACPARK